MDFRPIMKKAINEDEFNQMMGGAGDMEQPPQEQHFIGTRFQMGETVQVFNSLTQRSMNGEVGEIVDVTEGDQVNYDGGRTNYYTVQFSHPTGEMMTLDIPEDELKGVDTTGTTDSLNDLWKNSRRRLAATLADTTGEGRTPQTFAEALREHPRPSHDLLDYLRSIQR